VRRITQLLLHALWVFLVCATSCKKTRVQTYQRTLDLASLQGGAYLLTKQVPKFESADIIQTDSGLLAALSNDYLNGDKKNIYKCMSHDGGKTWTEPEKLNLKNMGWEFLNVNLLKVNKRIFLISQRRKKGVGAGEGAIPAFSYSDDNGTTWSKPRLLLSGKEREFIVINSRNVTQTRTRRLIIPVAHGALKLTVGILYSDDNGANWKEGPSSFGGIDIKAAKFAEPSIAQLKDGRLIMLIRTALGWIYKSYSGDDGITWSEPVATTLQSPWTAHTMRVTPDGALVVVYCRGPNLNLGWPRNNLMFAFSRDNGESWKDSRTIIDHTDPQYFVMEPSITFMGDKILVSYVQGSAWPDKYTDVCIKAAIFNTHDILR